ncbi:MAG TPA: ATP-binding protein [Phycisphaerales bacterium]|nr:ATP-binding protein [Phycisphaerales bacterium]
MEGARGDGDAAADAMTNGQPQAGPTNDRCCEARIELTSNTAYLCSVRDVVRRVARRMGFGDDQAAQIVLAVDEGLANVMKHGYDGRPDGPIAVELCGCCDCARGPGIRIVVEDRARQVDPATIKSRDLDDIRPGGLGVHIMREVMDTVHYEPREGGGMRLTLVKFLSSPAVAGGRGGCQHA